MPVLRPTIPVSRSGAKNAEGGTDSGLKGRHITDRGKGVLAVAPGDVARRDAGVVWPAAMFCRSSSNVLQE